MPADGIKSIDENNKTRKLGKLQLKERDAEHRIPSIFEDCLLTRGLNKALKFSFYAWGAEGREWQWMIAKVQGERWYGTGKEVQEKIGG